MTLTVTDLAVAKAGLPLLEGMSFSVPAGAALLLRGPNGIGKTTLLRTVAGLQPAFSGRIVAPDDGLAYAAHADGVKSVLTVEENLAFWSGVYGTNLIYRAKVSMDLVSLADRPARALSAGQRRRLGLARLLVTGRALWLMDEPTVSLDAASIARLAEVLRAHLGEGGSALIATHVDLGLREAESLDLLPFRAKPRAAFGGAEGFS